MIKTLMVIILAVVVIPVNAESILPLQQTTSGTVQCFGTMSCGVAVYPPEEPYTLVLRDKLGKTVLIRGIYRASWPTAEMECRSIATILKTSLDIESADCFK